MILKLIEFINHNNNWRELISKPPYCITIKEDEDYIMFNYNQLSSDFNNSIVKECRGLILHTETYDPVCIPFFKFGNYGENYADEIDWDTALVEEKVDGSLIKFWYDDGSWHISTNGTIDAYKAILSNDVKYKSFGELVEAAMPISMEQFDIIADRQCTYMFELVSPYNRIVVPYSTTSLYFIGWRNNITLLEDNPYNSELSRYFELPHKYPLSSLEECIQSANKLPFSEEGYVVVDKDFHRNKIKSPAWVAIHHMINNGNINKKRMIELIISGEHGEFLNYFPEYTEDFNNIADLLNEWLFKTTNTWIAIQIKLSLCKTRKEIAEIIMSTDVCPAVYFSLLDHKVNSIAEWLYKQSADKILKLIEEE